MTHDDPIQAQLIAARRTQILDAATKVFAEKGFERATIKDVAKTAGIADGTIYNYFKSKSDLLLGILNRLNESEQRRDDLAQISQGSVREQTRAYIKHRFEVLQTQGFEVMRVMLSEVLVNPAVGRSYFEQLVQPTFDLAEPFIKQQVEQGMFREMDSALILRFISGSFLGLTLLRLMGDPKLIEQWDNLPDLLTDILLDGLAANGDNSSSSSK